MLKYLHCMRCRWRWPWGIWRPRWWWRRRPTEHTLANPLAYLDAFPLVDSIPIMDP